MKIAIAGATGFVGKELSKSLAQRYTVFALSRNPLPKELDEQKQIFWKKCDLHNQKQVELSLDEADCAIYLIHSMLPNLRLNQGTFDDFDMSLADNFGRAAKLAGVKRIIYLSGLIPEEVQLSLHLKSRLEVETALRFYYRNLTVLRAGIIAGDGGSSFTIVYNLVKRLPVMICPAWTHHRTSIITLNDTVNSLEHCIEAKETAGKTFDIGSTENLTYVDIMRKTAEHLKLKRKFITVPWFTLNLSRLWVSLISGAPKSLVYPLVQSLRHAMVVRQDHRLIIPQHSFARVDDILKAVLGTYAHSNPHAFKKPKFSLSWYGSVRSIQRMPLPEGKSAQWLADRYVNWLAAYLPWMIQASRRNGRVQLTLPYLKIVLLSFSYSPVRSSRDRILYYIDGGVLASKKNTKGRIEFRKIPPGHTSGLVAIHDFVPALPWFIYRYTQAKIHYGIMRAFRRYLQRYSKKRARSYKVLNKVRFAD